MKIVDKLADKRILIWGYGREGKTTEEFIKKHCQVACLDVFEGKETELETEPYDYIIKSPGISVQKWNDKFTSQTELFLEEFAGQTIGITGTKGKSTTSTLLHHVLAACLDRKVLLMGNIGLPCLSCYDQIDEETIIVFEMSCHQLYHNRFSPHIAVFLNLFEDHLDYYGTRECYFEAKKGITNHQTFEDYLYVGAQVPDLVTKAKVVTLPMFEGDKKEATRLQVEGEERPFRTFQMKLQGNHNQFNANVVYTICTEQLGCASEAVIKCIEDFEGLSHRMQYVATVDEVAYYNDSISTIPEATIAAIQSISNAKTVLIGGMDRGIHYECLIDFIKNHGEYCYIMSYESGKRIYDQVAELSYCYYVKDLQESVELAREITGKGQAVLLSPAAASYGYFKNFEERGNVYMEIVRGFASTSDAV